MVGSPGTCFGERRIAFSFFLATCWTFEDRCFRARTGTANCWRLNCKLRKQSSQFGIGRRTCWRPQKYSIPCITPEGSWIPRTRSALSFIKRWIALSLSCPLFLETDTCILRHVIVLYDDVRLPRKKGKRRTNLPRNARNVL